MSRILIRDDQNILVLPHPAIVEMVEMILETVGEGEKEISLVFVDDASMRDFNKEHMGRDRPTNVLSFSYQGKGDPGEPGFDNPLLGEVLVSVETCVRHAKNAGFAALEEVIFCLVHGIAHLLGYDHEGVTPAEKRRMENFEGDLFRRFGPIAWGG